MFSKEDLICVALSGGKDSLSLLHALHMLEYKVKAVFVDLGIPGYSDGSRKACERLCSDLGVDLHIYNLKEERGMTIFEVSRRARRPPCSICGAIKRQATNRMARELGCDVLATGHNLDDEVAFLFSNLINWNLSYLARQGPVSEAKFKMVKKVKPLCFLTDEEVRIYAEIVGLEVFEGRCPLEGRAPLPLYKKIWNELEERRSDIKSSFYKGFLRKLKPLLAVEEGELRSCKVCGEPTSRDVCSVCSVFLRAKSRR